MILKKHKTSGVWYAHYLDKNGKRRTISTKATNQVEAERIADQSGIIKIESEARSGRIGAEVFSRAILGRNGITISQAAPEWYQWLQDFTESKHTQASYYARVLGWIKAMGIGSVLCSELKPEHIDQWVNMPDKGQLTNRKYLLACIASFVTWANKKGYIIGNPCKLVRIRKSKLSHQQKEKKIIQLFTEKEVAVLLDTVHPDSDEKYADGFWFCAIAFARYAGLRIGDICSLHSDCLSNFGYLTVWTAKRDTRVEIPLSNTFLQQAVLWLPQVSGEFWPTRSSESADPSVRSKTSVQFKRLCDTLEIYGKTFHSLRHTFANECLKNQTSYRHISALMGHRSEQTTRKHYLKEAIAKDGQQPSDSTS